MNLDRLLPLFQHSPLMRLLRADHAPFILSFLDGLYKQRQQIEVEQEDFLVALRDFQEDLVEEGREELTRPAEEYLVEWVGEKARFLRRFLAPEKDVWMIELQPETEEALHFIETVLSNQERSLGTESRMQMIVEAIRELVLYASGDVDAQLERLESEKLRIEERIVALKESGQSENLGQRQVVERFHIILARLRELTGDFRGVEERFREIVRGLQERERVSDGRTGDVLAYVLDAEDELKEHPHGASFYAFVRFVLSGEKRDDFDEMVNELITLDDLKGDSSGIERLRGMMPLLTEEATKILSTTQRLSAALRRLLDPRASEEHRQLTSELQEIMRVAGQRRDDPELVHLESEIDQSVSLDSPMTRDFWAPPSGFTEVEPNDEEPADAEALKLRLREEYAQLKRLDWKRMETSIAKALKKSPQVPLEVLLAGQTLEAGLVEVLGYLQLAHDGGHLVDDSQQALISVMIAEGETRLVKLPRIVFTAVSS